MASIFSPSDVSSICRSSEILGDPMLLYMTPSSVRAGLNPLGFSLECPSARHSRALV